MATCSDNKTWILLDGVDKCASVDGAGNILNDTIEDTNEQKAATTTTTTTEENKNPFDDSAQKPKKEMNKYLKYGLIIMTVGVTGFLIWKVGPSWYNRLKAIMRKNRMAKAA
jgi:hypothetical protein